MKTVKVGKKTIEIYDSIDELPIKRFHKFNKYLLVDSGIGSDLNDINDHIAKIKRYVNSNDKSNANRQLDNLRQSLYMVSQETHLRHLSFMVLIKSINGKEVHDLSDENLKKLLKEFENESKSFLDRLIESVKKKIDQELNLYFPGNFDDASVKEYYDKIRNRALLQLDAIIRDVDNDEKIDKIEEFLLTLAKPKVFSGKDSVEIKYDKQFEEMCLFLKQELSVEPQDMTVLQFYNSFEYLKKQKKPNGRKSTKI